MTLFDIVKKFAEQKAKGKELNVFHMLYGIATVLGLSEATINTLVGSENGKVEVAALRKVVEELGLDIELVKIGLAPIFLKLSDKNSKEVDMTAILADGQAANG